MTATATYEVPVPIPEDIQDLERRATDTMINHELDQLGTRTEGNVEYQEEQERLRQEYESRQESIWSKMWGGVKWVADKVIVKPIQWAVNHPILTIAIVGGALGLWYSGAITKGLSALPELGQTIMNSDVVRRVGEWLSVVKDGTGGIRPA